MAISISITKWQAPHKITSQHQFSLSIRAFGSYISDFFVELFPDGEGDIRSFLNSLRPKLFFLMSCAGALLHQLGLQLCSISLYSTILRWRFQNNPFAWNK